MTSQTYPKNAWYVAAMSDEIGLEKPLGRTVCGERIAFYRPRQSEIAAVLDFCPHRGAPLSLGFVEDGLLVCGYHGLKMGEDGETRAMPMQRVQGFACMQSYAAEDRYGFIWVWPGEQSKADRSLIPHLEWAVSDDWAYGGGLYHIQCDYRLMIDNLMDLTHETYVHASSIGQKEIDESPVVTDVVGEGVMTSRYMDNIMPPPFWQAALKANGLADDVLVDRWQRCRFTPPSHVMIDVGVAHAGHGGFDAPGEYKASSIVVDFLTPENEDSMWYFWGMARHFKADDPALTAQIKEGQGRIFQEDLDMLECQQNNLKTFPDYNLLKLNIDAGGVQSRKVIEKIILEEQRLAATQAVAPSQPLQTISF